MNLIDTLTEKWNDVSYPFLIHPTKNLKFSDITSQKPINLSKIKQGDVVALIGDFDPPSILTLLQIIDKGVIVVPLTNETKKDHQYFFKSALVDIVIKDGIVERREHIGKHQLIENLREKNHAGFSQVHVGETYSVGFWSKNKSYRIRKH